MTDYPHKDPEFETSDFDPNQYVPNGFDLDEVIDFKRKVNYIYQERGGEDVWRVSVHKDKMLYTVWLYANNKEAGHSRSIECRSESEVKSAYRELVDHLEQSA